ncbi:reverse transcriptase domain-containing protein [Mycobacterium sp. IS-1264]|uniref:reverse transcriptase domain-containing protein n=1 Tax=Mycobacterium sp. IS-1264 TaxID=1834158 RepID=UPI00096F32C5|nr:reverse transcriptase domain-containing protein [Mycobacterium sp. IS-1264]
MWWKLQQAIESAANRRIQNHERYAKWVFDENVRRARRCVGDPTRLRVQRPPLWDISPGFDPYRVRAHASSIAHSMTSRLKRANYAPFEPAQFELDKPGGGTRTVTAFQIADEVISYRLLQSLSRKNLSRMSARAFAYRAGLSPHDALAYARQELEGKHRLFIAEYDFTKYFDRIDHKFLYESLDDLGIIRTSLEDRLIHAFLDTPIPHLVKTESGQLRPSGKAGLAQGTSVSLFLANIAATKLDRALERLGVGFVRYADDTLIWSPDYSRICMAAEVLHEAAEQIGTPINVAKSPGIRLLVRHPEAQTELKNTIAVDYLGHSLGLGQVRMRESAVTRIKTKIGGLIYNNLLREPMARRQSARQLTGNDRDYITCILQIRRYMYGPLGEAEVRRFIQGSIPFMSFEGVMAFFPLVNDIEQLSHLDGWLSNQIWLALGRRQQLLIQQGLPTPKPMGLSKQELIGFTTVSSTTRRTVDLRLPSFIRVAKVVKRATQTYGFGVVPGGNSLYLYD